jgi:hypothetical protein
MMYVSVARRHCLLILLPTYKPYAGQWCGLRSLGQKVSEEGAFRQSICQL